MKITIDIPNKIISKMKYIFLGLFIILSIAYVYFFEGAKANIHLLLAVVFAIYMAINLGANDVANNMGPAVGAKAISLGGAIVIAMIFEAAGALIAGGDVVNTIKGGIIDPKQFDDGLQFIAIMLATLLGSAIWVNIATLLKAPVSITHSILGGLIGAGVMAGGVGVVNWYVMGKVAIALIIAIFMGGIIATLIYISIRKNILKQKNKGEAAKHWVPVYVSLMTLVFSVYLISKGFKHKLIDSFQHRYEEGLELGSSIFDFFIKEVHKFDKAGNEIIKYDEFGKKIIKVSIDNSSAIFVGICISVIVYVLFIIYYKNKKKKYFEDNKEFVNTLFNTPLIFAVALLSFAHGANDVANAIGPLAAINEAVSHSGEVIQKAGIPFWVMIIGALSLSFGLAVFGGRLIKTVGKSITKLDQIRAYSIALAAAITVIIASSLGIPVSTTQIALGGIFGIGLYRQYLNNKKGKDKQVIEMSKLKGIILSWVITFPVAGAISAVTYKIVMLLSK